VRPGRQQVHFDIAQLFMKRSLELDDLVALGDLR
jgi:hypothetical protein